MSCVVNTLESYFNLGSLGFLHELITDNGNEYEGTWIANKRDGNGTTKYASGNMYVGAWKEGMC